MIDIIRPDSKMERQIFETKIGNYKYVLFPSQHCVRHTVNVSANAAIVLMFGQTPLGP